MNKPKQSCISLPVELSIATFPFLLLLSTLKSLEKNTEDIGKLSEEIFRGERLPLLSFPESDRTDS